MGQAIFFLASIYARGLLSSLVFEVYHAVPRICQLLGIVELNFVTSLRVYISFFTIVEEIIAWVCSLVGGRMRRIFVLVVGDRLPVERKKKLISMYTMICLRVGPLGRMLYCFSLWEDDFPVTKKNKNDKIVYVNNENC